MPTTTPGIDKPASEQNGGASWGAIFCGVSLSLATLVLFSLLGIATGVSLSAEGGSPPHAPGVADSIFLFVTIIASFFFGGFVTARLSGARPYLNATVLGMSAWAVATLLMAFSVATSPQETARILFSPNQSVSRKSSLSEKVILPKRKGKTASKITRGKRVSTPITSAEMQPPWIAFFALLLSGLCSALGALVGNPLRKQLREHQSTEKRLIA